MLQAAFGLQVPLTQVWLAGQSCGVLQPPVGGWPAGLQLPWSQIHVGGHSLLSAQPVGSFAHWLPMQTGRAA